MTYSNDVRIIINSMIAFILYSLGVALAISTLLLDIIWLKHGVYEYSITEISQELALLLITIIFVRLAFKYEVQRNAHILIAGFFFCLLIRELDSFFDLITHGFWLYPALFVSIIALAMTFLRNPKLTIHQLAKYTQQPHYIYMMAGLICILVFSRLFGMGILWKALLNENYSRDIKNIAEEGPELLGYVFCTISTLFYCRFFIKSQNKQSA